ncbi:FMN-dependent alpha-hydroxy acid dehydrogenase, partial [Pleomassaria siparia CBS 279.74]
ISFLVFKAGADAEITSNWNRISWQAIRFRPRILKPLNCVNISTTLLDTPFSAPFFISPAGGGKLANRSGEVLLTKAAAKHGILHFVCNNAGCTQQEIADARGPDQVLYWQIYAMKDLAGTEREIKQAIASGYKGFALTVDAIHVGKRERDMRLSIATSEGDSNGLNDDDEDSGLSGGISVSRLAVYSDFDWITAIKWLRQITNLPIAIKGVQCWEDAALCMHHGVHPWLSNHGGRQLEGAPSAVETLLEIHQHCPAVFDKSDVIVDGGITRGTDIVKALALGAKGVGLGRAFLYALVFGEVGISRAIRILQLEVETAMRLLGVASINELSPSHVSMPGSF